MDSTPASAPLRRSCTTRVATPSWISGTRPLARALGVEAARQAEPVARRVGEVDGRRGHLLAEPPRERAAALRVGQPVERARREQVEQLTHRVRLHHDRVLARAPAPPASPRERGLAGGALGERTPASSSATAAPPRRRNRCGGRQARCRSPSCRRPWCGRSPPPAPSVTRALVLRDRPDPVRLEPGRSADRERGRQRLRRPVPGRARRWRGRGPVVGAARARRGEAREGRPAPLPRPPRPLPWPRRGAAARVPPGRSRFVVARPTWPSAHHRELDRHVVDGGGLGRPVAAKRSISERSRARRGERLGRRRRETARLGELERVQSHDPDLDVAEAGRRGAVGDAHQSGPARPCRSRAATPERPLRRRADGVAAGPELRASPRRSSGCAPAGRALPSSISQAASPSNWKCRRRSSIDHERLVSISRPSSVSAIRSSSVPASPGSRFTLCHAHDRLAGEAVRAHAAAGALEADLGRPSRARRGSRPARPSRTIGTAWPSTPSSSQR